MATSHQDPPSARTTAIRTAVLLTGTVGAAAAFNLTLMSPGDDEASATAQLASSQDQNPPAAPTAVVVDVPVVVTSADANSATLVAAG